VTGQTPTRVALFLTCLVDLFRPRVGLASVHLLEAAGCQVELPWPQTCCGQPAYNNGDSQTAEAIARQVIELFEPYPYVVAPSGSCIGMLREHYPRLLADDAQWAGRAAQFAQRCYELTSFLRDVLGYQDIQARHAACATYHDSCSGLRELGIKAQPRALLAQIQGLELREHDAAEECCGFGGTFCVKYPDISERMVSEKIDSIEATGAQYVIGADLGCLLNIAGRLRRLGKTTKVFHIAEVLAGLANGPSIGEPDSD